MTRLIDLTLTLDPANLEKIPPSMAALSSIFAPQIEYHDHKGVGREWMCAAFGCTQDDLPDGEGWGAEIILQMASHCGTHVDAPFHSGSRCEGRPARTITDIGLEELYRPGIVLDVRPWVKPGMAIPVEALDKAIAATGADIPQGGAALLRTGQEAYNIGDPEYMAYPGMSREGTLFLIERGARILGTDALGWDRPFDVMRRRFAETGDRREIWDAHFAIREREAFIVQQLTDLGALPLSGFIVACFPIKLANTSAAPARVVAFVD